MASVVNSYSETSTSALDEYYSDLFIELAEIFGEDVLIQSNYMTMADMFSYVDELDACVLKLRSVDVDGYHYDEYQRIIDSLRPELSVALCKWIADGWACDIKH